SRQHSLKSINSKSPNRHSRKFFLMKFPQYFFISSKLRHQQKLVDALKKFIWNLGVVAIPSGMTV
ncbi:MAG: hypothetical protein V1688_04945, partial [bacterium]